MRHSLNATAKFCKWTTTSLDSDHVGPLAGVSPITVNRTIEIEAQGTVMAKQERTRSISSSLGESVAFSHPVAAESSSPQNKNDRATESKQTLLKSGDDSNLRKNKGSKSDPTMTTPENYATKSKQETTMPLMTIAALYV